jgi:hypothetical protein
MREGGGTLISTSAAMRSLFVLSLMVMNFSLVRGMVCSLICEMASGRSLSALRLKSLNSSRSVNSWFSCCVSTSQSVSHEREMTHLHHPLYDRLGVRIISLFHVELP